MMQIKTAKFVRSVTGIETYFNNELPEIAVVGKSNAGKSTLINMLTNNGKLARVSKQPGKTRMINYFLINGGFYLVDLPGYGFAKAPKAEKEAWDAMMGDYFAHSPMLKAVIILLDIRHEPSPEDKAMVTLAEYHSIPYLICATKADKIAKSKRKTECARLRRIIPSSFDYKVIPVSYDSYGKEELLSAIEGKLNAE